ncbi:MAG: alcohol dehydrogenase catalytic domain-containing protein [Nitrososphaerales archaeon]
MKAAVMKVFGEPLVIEDFPTPKIGPTDVLVKVSACGLCYSDVKIWTGRSSAKALLPHIMGHEISGTVAACGENVSGLESGDHATVYVYDTCDRCPACKSGQDTFCPNMGPLLGFTRHGGFAEYVSIPSKNVFKIPKDMNMEEAALLPDAVLTPYHAIVDRAKVRFNETVMLLGMGGLALNGVQILKLMGARVIAVSRTQNKLDLAKKLGADVVINSSELDLPTEVKKATGGRGVDCAVDFVVNGSTLEQCVRSLRRGGRAIMLGYSLEPLQLNTSLLLSTIGSIQASRSGTRQNLRDIIKLASAGKLRSILSETRDNSEINTVLKRLSNGDVTGRVALRL